MLDMPIVDKQQLHLGCPNQSYILCSIFHQNILLKYLPCHFFQTLVEYLREYSLTYEYLYSSAEAKQYSSKIIQLLHSCYYPDTSLPRHHHAGSCGHQYWNYLCSQLADSHFQSMLHCPGIFHHILDHSKHYDKG